jgi:glyoxylase-like metal-dependent hydrolase (beta-lactamase superfamily II)
MYGETVGIYLIDTPEQVVIIDGPRAQDGLIEALKKKGKPVTVVLTHGPAFNKADRLVQALGAKILLHKLDSTNSWLGRKNVYCTYWEGDSHVVVSGVTLYHSGGHSKGHCLIYDAEKPGILFTGDEIYADGHGVVQLEEELRREPLCTSYLDRLSQITSGLNFEYALPLHGNLFLSAAKQIAARFFS